MSRTDRHPAILACRSAAVLLAATVPLAGCGSSGGSSAAAAGSGTAATAARRTAARAPSNHAPALKVTRTTTLPGAVQWPATTAVGGQAVFAGGLSQADTSLSTVAVASSAGSASAPALPIALHDAAATTLAGKAYLFGGGEPSLSAIRTIGPGVTPTTVGRLPTAASDVAAATVGDTAYIVGGYDGSNPLSAIVAWKGSGTGTVAAHLPVAVRYAAVAAAGTGLIVIGGTVDGVASRGVYLFDPASGSVRTIGRLPHPLTHATAATVGRWVYVFGGRGSVQGTQTARILAINPATGRVSAAGRLPRALSDAGAASVGSTVLLGGGRTRSGLVSDQVLTLAPASASR